MCDVWGQSVRTYDIWSAKYDCIFALNGHATAVKELDASLYSLHRDRLRIQFIFMHFDIMKSLCSGNDSGSVCSTVEVIDVSYQLITCGVQDTWNPMLSNDQAALPGACVFVLANCATLSGWRPSTSLCWAMRSMIACSSRWPGRGSCTKMPLTLGSCIKRKCSWQYVRNDESRWSWCRK